MVEAILPLVDWIDWIRTEWIRIIAKQEATTQFAYDLSWIVSAYLNACILALTTAVEGYLGVCTPVSLQYLIDELDQGWYTGHTLLRYLQDLLTARVG